MCDDGTGNHEMVANPRREQIRATLTNLAPGLESLRAAFDPAERATMSAGAWTGAPADRFGDGLSARARRLGRAAEQAREQLLEELAAEPEQVRRCETYGTIPGWPLTLPPVGSRG
ncbi:hypothetical protein [uncultured Serinicoccus sp.]|uniref:hypothetical protein n=1 Tax=uncultured Serinicoccus sp. TaxID=735514 RepID=UPI00260ED037|nr:hypothetical protein [uncultured Serinicoccus sp.]